MWMKIRKMGKNSQSQAQIYIALLQEKRIRGVPDLMTKTRNEYNGWGNNHVTLCTKSKARKG